MAFMKSSEAAEVIAIIGGGFSGTMVAFHLARLARPESLRVLLFEKGPQFATVSLTARAAISIFSTSRPV